METLDEVASGPSAESSATYEAPDWMFIGSERDTKADAHTDSTLIGVTHNETLGKWTAYICVEGKVVNLGEEIFTNLPPLTY